MMDLRRLPLYYFHQLSLHLTDKELNPNFIPSHRQIDVFFSYDSSTELGGTGFQAEFRAIKSDCGEVFLAGQEWSALVFCHWFLYTEKQQHLEVICEQFSFPAISGNCLDEFLELRDVGTLSECQHPACATEPLQEQKRKEVIG
ncbi:unnamed protein product [Meloidogyne enterolobii]|uniref:Uncharacterized protein n=1 Tax=Meloidogyne enterolobii TaxID=390850 RepID=A0ACB0Y657_MELEN